MASFSLRLAVSRCLLRPTSNILIRSVPRSKVSTRPTAYEEMNRYWVKNRQLNRPLSPHLTVFKPHLTMVLSITNRVMAVALQSGIVIGSTALMLLPGDFTHYMNKFRDLNINSIIIYSIKFIIAFPFAFHFVASVRHLLWDAGLGFGKTATYQGGWIVLAVTALATAALVFLIHPQPVYAEGQSDKQ